MNSKQNESPDMTGELWKSYSDKVCHYFKKRIDDELLACDLMQDTFHKVLDNRERLDRVRNPEAWIFQIARNTLIDYTRKKKEGTLDNLVIPDRPSTTDQKASEIDEIAGCLYELMNEYTGDEQDILWDVFTKSLTQKEAAKALDIPYSTFKSRVQKARREILGEFEERCCHLKYNDQNQIIGCMPVSG